jgi:hypothetical protein
MSNRRKVKSQRPGSKPWGSRVRLLLALAGLALAVIVAAILVGGRRRQPGAPSQATASAETPAPGAAPVQPSGETPSGAASGASSELLTMETAQAVMVTAELDFGPRVPTIAEALKEIERRYQPADGIGRTFAILDAYGEPTPDGKLHMSMHVSSEKPGIGSLAFRKTGEVLWQSKIVAAKSPPSSGKALTIFIDDGHGRSLLVDGSNGPTSILDATVKDLGVPVKTIWPDGQEREVTFVYSACGCPVKAMVKRVGDRTARTKELPVMFPDDPAAMVTISRLMRW